jgi:hypothetical protein
MEIHGHPGGGAVQQVGVGKAYYTIGGLGTRIVKRVFHCNGS